MSKILVLTAVVLAAGAGAIAKAISENPEGAATDILLLDAERASALTIAEQSLAQLEKQPAAQDSAPTFSHDGSTYGFKFKSMIHKGTRISVEDVVASEDLQSELVKMGSGMIYQKA